MSDNTQNQANKPSAKESATKEAAAATAEEPESDLINYFALFDLPLNFFIDKDKLEDSYLQLQSKFHPDKYVAADVLQRSIAAKKSSLINIAYKELLAPTTRAVHILKLIDKLAKAPKTNQSSAQDNAQDVSQNSDIDRESLDGEKTIKDPEFLMEQMRWREAVEDADDQKDKLQEIMDEIHQEQDSLYKEFDEKLRKIADSDKNSPRSPIDKNSSANSSDLIPSLMSMVDKMRYFSKIEKEIAARL